MQLSGHFVPSLWIQIFPLNHFKGMFLPYKMETPTVARHLRRSERIDVPLLPFHTRELDQPLGLNPIFSDNNFHRKEFEFGPSTRNPVSGILGRDWRVDKRRAFPNTNNAHILDHPVDKSHQESPKWRRNSHRSTRARGLQKTLMFLLSHQKCHRTRRPCHRLARRRRGSMLKTWSALILQPGINRRPCHRLVRLHHGSMTKTWNALTLHTSHNHLHSLPAHDHPLR